MSSGKPALNQLLAVSVWLLACDLRILRSNDRDPRPDEKAEAGAVCSRLEFSKISGSYAPACFSAKSPMTGNFHFSPLLALISSMTQTIRPPSQTPIKSKMWRIVPSIGMKLRTIPILGTILHILLLIGVWLGGLIV